MSSHSLSGDMRSSSQTRSRHSHMTRKTTDTCDTYEPSHPTSEPHKTSPTLSLPPRLTPPWFRNTTTRTRRVPLACARALRWSARDWTTRRDKRLHGDEHMCNLSTSHHWAKLCRMMSPRDATRAEHTYIHPKRAEPAPRLIVRLCSRAHHYAGVSQLRLLANADVEAYVNVNGIIGSDRACFMRGEWGPRNRLENGQSDSSRLFFFVCERVDSLQNASDLFQSIVLHSKTQHNTHGMHSVYRMYQALFRFIFAFINFFYVLNLCVRSHFSRIRNSQWHSAINERYSSNPQFAIQGRIVCRTNRRKRKKKWKT